MQLGLGSHCIAWIYKTTVMEVDWSALKYLLGLCAFQDFPLDADDEPVIYQDLSARQQLAVIMKM